MNIINSNKIKHMLPITKSAYHGPEQIPQEGKWVQKKEIKDISGVIKKKKLKRHFSYNPYS